MSFICKGDVVRFRHPSYKDKILIDRILSIPFRKGDLYIVSDGNRTYQITRCLIINKIN